MPINKNGVLRYNALDKCLSNPGREYFFDDLMNEVNNALLMEDPKSTGIQIRQLRKDIQFMKSEAGYSAPILAYRYMKKAFYRYEDLSFSINNSPLNQLEANQLKSALAILQRFEGSPEFEWVNEIGPMLRDQFGLKETEEKIIGYDSNIDYSGYEYIAPLFNAISNKRVLNVKYKTFQNEEFDYQFHPYYLKQYNNRWFAFGYNSETKVDQWNLPLDRIAEIAEIDQIFRNSNMDWEDFFYDIIGVTKKEGETQEIKLIFSKAQGPYINTKPLHPSQKSKLLDDGKLAVRIQVIPNYELEQMILSFGENVEIVTPLLLREKIIQRISTMRNQY